MMKMGIISKIFCFTKKADGNIFWEFSCEVTGKSINEENGVRACTYV